MPETKQILAGRAAIDAYRQAHNRLQPAEADHSIDHSQIMEALLSVLKAQGFNSIEEFTTANTQAVKADMERCIQYEGECDNCEGREEARGCETNCYQKATIEMGRTSVTPDLQRNGLATLSHFADYFKTLPLRKKGRITQMVPNCSIETHIIEDPALDWDWR